MAKPFKQLITRYVVDVAPGTRAAKPLADAGGKLFYGRYTDATGKPRCEPLTADRKTAQAKLAELLNKHPAADGELPELFQPAYTGWAKFVKSTTPGARKIRQQSAKWYGRYRDADGGLKIEPLAEDLNHAQAMLADKQRTAAKQRAGYADDYTPHAKQPTLRHLEDFRRHLKAGGNTEKYTSQTYGRVLAAMKGCRFTRLADMRASKLELWLERERAADRIGNKTSNYYLAAVKQFGRWLVKDGRLAKNPFEHVDTVKAEAEYERRPLNAEEFEWLIAATSNSAHVFRRLAGEDRAMVYLLAANTGFRAHELATLTPSRFELGAETPTVTIDAAYSKRRRRDVQPIRPDIAARLAEYLAGNPHKRTTAAATGRQCDFDKQRGKQFNGRVWASSWFNNAARMLRRDLRAARAVWLRSVPIGQRQECRESDFLRHVDSSDRVADFHALRHTFISNLAAAGVHPKTAQELARHSTIRLTMDRYAHVELRDSAAALEQLPLLPGDEGEQQPQQQRATGTDGRIVRYPQNPPPSPPQKPQAAKLFTDAVTYEPPAECPKRADGDGGISVEGRAQETPKPLPEQGLTSTATLETERGAGRIRTGGGGFAICRDRETQPIASSTLRADASKLFTDAVTDVPSADCPNLELSPRDSAIVAGDEFLSRLFATWDDLAPSEQTLINRIIELELSGPSRSTLEAALKSGRARPTSRCARA